MWDKMLKEGAWIGADQYLAYETGGPPELLLTRIAEYFGGALVFPNLVLKTTESQKAMLRQGGRYRVATVENRVIRITVRSGEAAATSRRCRRACAPGIVEATYQPNVR